MTGELETIDESLRREPGRESTQPAGQLLSGLLRAEGLDDLSAEAKDHLTRLESIAAAALKDLDDVSIEIEQFRDEIQSTRRHGRACNLYSTCEG